MRVNADPADRPHEAGDTHEKHGWTAERRVRQGERTDGPDAEGDLRLSTQVIHLRDEKDTRPEHERPERHERLPQILPRPLYLPEHEAGDLAAQHRRHEQPDAHGDRNRIPVGGHEADRTAADQRRADDVDGRQQQTRRPSRLVTGVACLNRIRLVLCHEPVADPPCELAPKLRCEVHPTHSSSAVRYRTMYFAPTGRASPSTARWHLTILTTNSLSCSRMRLAMRSDTSSSLWTTVLLISLACESSSALTIHRFGGDDTPPTKKLANPDDVEFMHSLWTDPARRPRKGR